MDERYLPPIDGGRWALSRTIAGKHIYLIQNTYMDDVGDIAIILFALNIACTKENTERFFPIRGCNGPCPTLELLELFSVIDRAPRNAGKEVGV